MKKDFSKSRRSFLQTSAAGAAGLAIAGIAPKKASAQSAGAWVDGMRINPLIDNLKVVSCQDDNMVYNDPTNWGFSSVNNAVNFNIVLNNMDEMAKELAGKPTAQEAWQTIFQQPVGKEWSEVLVAIKVNTINTQNMPRIAIVAKICQVLMGFGVPAGNIIIFDSCINRGNSHPGNYEPFIGAENGLPEGVIESDYGASLGGDSNTFPVPGLGNYRCVEHLGDGTVDILVNCAVNKGHGDDYGGVTLTMKNHFGTFDPNPHNYNYLIGINKSEAILGGAPPRQQLVIIDSLFASTYGPGGAPNMYPHRIIMGTFGPAVDYITAKTVRAVEMSTAPSGQLEDFLPDFGYSEEERDAMIMTEVSPATAVSPYSKKSVSDKNEPIVFSTGRGSLHNNSIRLSFPASEKISEISIFDLRGKLIWNSWNPPVSGKNRMIAWNGETISGVKAAKGTYVVSIKGKGRVVSEKFVY